MKYLNNRSRAKLRTFMLKNFLLEYFYYKLKVRKTDRKTYLNESSEKYCT